MSKLLIISHTEHYRNTKGEIVGWGPTVTEINYLATQFDEIYHLAVFLNEDAPPSSLAYTSKNIHFVPLKATGGKTLLHKLEVVRNAPSTIVKVIQLLKKVDVFQLRAPTGIGVYLIPFLTLFVKKKGWFKYAGNWNQNKPPLGYALQRWWLKKQRRKVTINGAWKYQLQQCLTFENPCLTQGNRVQGKLAIQKKIFKAPFTYCFAGRLEDSKGVRKIIEAFTAIKNKDLINEVHLIGGGDNLKEYKRLAEISNVKFIFHGFLKGSDVFKIFENSHFFLLPSTASEGFPKVIAEAMNYGCIPIVSNVSSIGQYIKNNKNGLVVYPITTEELSSKIKESFLLNIEIIRIMQDFNYSLCEKFMYDYYIDRLQKEIVEGN